MNSIQDVCSIIYILPDIEWFWTSNELELQWWSRNIENWFLITERYHNVRCWSSCDSDEHYWQCIIEDACGDSLLCVYTYCWWYQLKWYKLVMVWSWYGVARLWWWWFSWHGLHDYPMKDGQMKKRKEKDWQNSRWKLNPKSKNIQTDTSCTKLAIELCCILIILTKLELFVAF